MLSKETCALRVVSGDPHLNNLLLKYAEEALVDASTKPADLLTKVQNSIVPLLPHGNVRVASVAKRLGLSERTLARKLASVGLTYSEALEQLRRVLARRYLAEDDLSVSRVAWLLGFREVSAFTNAFRRWTGHTPTAERTGGKGSTKDVLAPPSLQRRVAQASNQGPKAVRAQPAPTQDLPQQDLAGKHSAGSALLNWTR